MSEKDAETQVDEIMDKLDPDSSSSIDYASIKFNLIHRVCLCHNK